MSTLIDGDDPEAFFTVDGEFFVPRMPKTVGFTRGTPECGSPAVRVDEWARAAAQKSLWVHADYTLTLKRLPDGD